MLSIFKPTPPPKPSHRHVLNDYLYKVVLVEDDFFWVKQDDAVAITTKDSGFVPVTKYYLSLITDFYSRPVEKPDEFYDHNDSYCIKKYEVLYINVKNVVSVSSPQSYALYEKIKEP